MRHGHLQRGQSPVVDVDFVQRRARQLLGTEPLAEAEAVEVAAEQAAEQGWHGAAGEIVLAHLHRDLGPVEVELHPGGPTGPVVGDRDVGPLLGGQGRLRDHAQHVVGADVDHVELQSVIFQLQSVAGVRGPHGVVLVVHHRGVVVDLALGRLQPQVEAEVVVALVPADALGEEAAAVVDQEGLALDPVYEGRPLQSGGGDAGRAAGGQHDVLLRQPHRQLGCRLGWRRLLAGGHAIAGRHDEA